MEEAGTCSSTSAETEGAWGEWVTPPPPPYFKLFLMMSILIFLPFPCESMCECILYSNSPQWAKLFWPKRKKTETKATRKFHKSGDQIIRTVTSFLDICPGVRPAATM